MSHSKVTISQSMSKIMQNRLPEKRSPNILNKSNNISQSSKTSRVLDESFHNNSKLHNTSGLEIRHFLNLLNITDEDPKNLSSKPQSKSPVKNTTSFVQINTSPITKRASPTKKPLLNSAPDHHKNYANRSFISHAAESMNTIYEDKSITDPPSPTFYNPSHSILNKRSSMDGDRSYNNAKTSSQPNLCRSARNSILGGILGGLGETTPTKKSPMAGKSYTRPPSINTISGDIKKVSYSKALEKDSRSKESSPFNNKNFANNSMYSTQSISMIENIKSSSEKDKARQGNKSPLAINQKRSSTGNINYQEGFNMKPVLEDVLDFPDKVKKMHNLIPKEKTKKVNGDNLNSGYTNYTNTSSYPQNAYNDLLNKKFGGIPQKANFFGTSKSNTEYKAKQSVRGSMNEISESTILDMILNSTTTTMHTEKKKYADTKVNSMQMIETRPLIKEVSLDVMNQIPKGILVNKSIERKPKSKPIAQENRPQEKPKVDTVLKNKPNTPERQVNISTAKTNTKPPEQRKQIDRKESIFSVEHSEDSSVIQSPLQLAYDDEHKSKSMVSLNLQRRSSSTKPAPNEGNVGPQGQRLTRGRSNAVAVLKRSSSMRRAKKEEEMDGKSVKTRKENKEFIELLNKISKNNQTDQIQAMFGKDEESLVKDLVEYIQAQNLSIGRARSSSFHKRMTVLEKRIEEVRAKIPSLSALGLEEDNKSDSCSDSKTVRSVENAYSLTPSHKEEEKTSFVPHRTKRSSFSLEAAKKLSTTTHGSSINDIQNPETGPMQHLLVPMIDNQNQQDKIVFTPSLGPLSLQNIPLDKKELIKLEDSARGTDSQTENKTPHNKENSKANTPESEKRENTEAAVELPVFGRTSTLHTQESTSSSLLTVAIETPPSKERESGTLPVLDGEETKQDNQLLTSNREPSLQSPSLMFSVLSNGSNNKPAIPTTIVTPPPKEQSSPPRNNSANTEENNNQLKPTLQRSEFANGSFGCLPQPVEPTRTTTQEPAPKFGGLSSLTFRPPLPATHTSIEDSAKPGMNISMVVHLKKKLKPVYIEKLDPEHLKATVYGEIHEKEHPGVSFGDLHDLFENAPLNKPAVAPAQPKKELKSLIIDGKRAQNMSILAMKFRKLPVNEFRDAIINLDPVILTSETCSTLLPFCPLPDEIKACQNNKEPLEKLDTASQFMLNIYDIPQLGARLRSTIFKNEFKERLDSVLDAINKVKTACDILKENVHFKVFLRLSLEVANTLNEGTTRGSALGLKPASLLSFDTVRSNKPGLTLLVYMAQKIFEQKPEILDFTADFSGIGDATKINIQDPIRSIQELKKDMNQLRLQLEISMDKNPPDTGFSNTFKSFYDSSAPLLVEAEEKYNKTNEHYVETAKFLGEDDESLKKKTSMEFFKVFKHLADTVEKFRSDEVEKRKREARRAAMKK